MAKPVVQLVRSPSAELRREIHDLYVSTWLRTYNQQAVFLDDADAAAVLVSLGYTITVEEARLLPDAETEDLMVKWLERELVYAGSHDDMWTVTCGGQLEGLAYITQHQDYIELGQLVVTSMAHIEQIVGAIVTHYPALPIVGTVREKNEFLIHFYTVRFNAARCDKLSEPYARKGAYVALEVSHADALIGSSVE